MSNEGKLYTLALSVLLGVMLIGFGMFLGYQFVDGSKTYHFREVTEMVDTIYVDRTDTLRIVEHDTIVEKQIGYKYVAVHDTIVQDSIVYMPLPITQKWYHEDSLCDVWVSGYEPQLDSLHVVQRHTVEIIKEREIIEGGRNIFGFSAGTKDAGIIYLREVGKFNVGFSAGSTYHGQPTVRVVFGFHF